MSSNKTTLQKALDVYRKWQKATEMSNAVKITTACTCGPGQVCAQCASQMWQQSGVWSYPSTGVHTTVWPQQQAPTKPDLISMIRSRLRMDPYATFKVQHLHAAEANDKVYVLVINAEPVILTDEAKMFPSDQLITQLRLLGVE